MLIAKHGILAWDQLRLPAQCEGVFPAQTSTGLVGSVSWLTGRALVQAIPCLLCCRCIHHMLCWLCFKGNQGPITPYFMESRSSCRPQPLAVVLVCHICGIQAGCRTQSVHVTVVTGHNHISCDSAPCGATFGWYVVQAQHRVLAASMLRQHVCHDGVLHPLTDAAGWQQALAWQLHDS